MSRIPSDTIRLVSRSKSILPFLALAHFVAGAGLAVEPVVAHTRNGRVLSGVVDSQTTPTRLWLRLTAPNIVAISSVDWRDVTRVEAQGRDYSVEEFRPEAMRQKSDVPANVFVKAVPERNELVVGDKRELGDRRNILPRVQSLKIDAELANWDQGAEVDGFAVRISPLALDRSVVPVSGMLTAELFGQNITPDEMFEPLRQDFSRLERWSVRLVRDDFAVVDPVGGAAGVREAVVRLPFRRIHPEFEVDVRNYGQLNVSLQVAGQGVYDATIPVIMRTYSPVRERLQQYRRYRFLPGERPGNVWSQHIGVFPGDVTGR